MSNLIDRQAAIDKFEPWLKVKGYSEGELNMLKAVLYELRFLPSAQPEPQKWLDHNYYLECPSCKRYVTNRTPFCPYCGGRNE